MNKNKIKRGKVDIAVLCVVGTLVILHCVLLLIPFIWVLIQSFNTNYNYMLNPFSFPKKWFDFSNYTFAFKALNITINTPARGKVIYNIYNMSIYSFIIAVVLTFMQTLASSLLGYATGKYGQWRLSKAIYAVNLFLIVFPTIGSLPSSLQLHRAMNTYNNLVPFLLVGHYGSGMHLIMFCGAFRALPNDYKEAAMMDGAGHFTVMFRIYYPMVFPLVASVFLLGFIGNWNNYMLCVTYLPSYPNLAYGIYFFQSMATVYGYSVPETLAGFVVVAIPTSILWICSQKLITSKLTVGGLKG